MTHAVIYKSIKIRKKKISLILKFNLDFQTLHFVKYFYLICEWRQPWFATSSAPHSILHEICTTYVDSGVII